MATDGYHTAKVLGWSLDERTGRDGPTQFVAVDLQVGDEIMRAELGLGEEFVEFLGKRRWEASLHDDLPACGFTGGVDLTMLDVHKPDAKQTVRVKVQTKESGGKTYTNVYIQKPRVPGQSSIEPAKRRALAARLAAGFAGRQEPSTEDGLAF